LLVIVALMTGGASVQKRACHRTRAAGGRYN